MKISAQNESLKVIARAPFKVHFEGEAQSVSAKNAVGNFDIMPGHADFFSMLEAGDIVINTGEESIEFKTTNGMVAVKDDEVMLFVNI